MMNKLSNKLLIILPLMLFSASPLKAFQEGSIEQHVIEALIKTTIMAFEHPHAKNNLSQFSQLIKDEYTYQFIIQKIDKFILTNELDEYEEQAEWLKESLTEMRELYIRSEESVLKKYNMMKEQQQEREKQRELKANNVIEV